MKVWAVAMDGTGVNHHRGPQQADGSLLSASATGTVAFPPLHHLPGN